MQEFYEQASVFVDARGKLEGLKLPNEERDFIEKIRAAAKTTSPLLHEVIDLVAKGQMSGARRYLSEKALPSQEHLIQVMAQALEHEFRESRGLRRFGATAAAAGLLVHGRERCCRHYARRPDCLVCNKPDIATRIRARAFQG